MGKTVLIMEQISSVAKSDGGFSVFAGVGERWVNMAILYSTDCIIHSEGNDLYHMMNEPPGTRARVTPAGLTVAEYFHNQEDQDMLLFRFTQVIGHLPSCYY